MKKLKKNLQTALKATSGHLKQSPKVAVPTKVRYSVRPRAVNEVKHNKVHGGTISCMNDVLLPNAPVILSTPVLLLVYPEGECTIHGETACLLSPCFLSLFQTL